MRARPGADTRRNAPNPGEPSAASGNYGVRILDEALDTALEMSPRYMRHQHLPDKVIGWLDTAAVRTEMDRRWEVRTADVVSVIMRFPTQSDAHDAIWDHAAGAVLVEQAGGRVTDLDGRAFDFSTGRRLLRNRGLVASNGVLHDVVLAAVRQSAAVQVER